MFALDPADVRGPILKECRLEHLEHAVDLYPGAQTRQDTIPDRVPVAVALDSCIRQIGLEGEGGARLVTSFLLRLIENRWRETSLRSSTLGMAEIVRPPDSMTAQADAVLASFDALIARLPPPPATAPAPDESGRLFAALCEKRQIMVELHEGLTRMAELKRLHDALHILQVLGESQLERARLVCADPAVRLEDEAEACRARCAAALNIAAGHLASGEAHGADFARVLLRQLFRVELPNINRLLCDAISRWPLRRMRELFDKGSEAAGVEYDRAALLDLHDTLLRRLLAHSLWQDVDLHLYDMEEIFEKQPQEWLVALVPHLTTVRLYLRALGAAPEPRQGLTSELTAAIESAAIRDDPATRDRLKAGYDELVWRARQNFVEVDARLKADFDHFMQLDARLGILILRVPVHCGLLI